MERPEFKIIEITESNIEEYGLLCQKSKKKEEGYQNKIKWIEERFREGMKYLLLLVVAVPIMLALGVIIFQITEKLLRKKALLGQY